MRVLDLLLSDFYRFVAENIGKVKVKEQKGVKGLTQYHRSTTFPAVVVIDPALDFYAQKFILLHELAHLYLNTLGHRQNEYIPDLLAAAYLWSEGMEEEDILDIMRILYPTRRNIWRIILVYLLLRYLSEEVGV